MTACAFMSTTAWSSRTGTSIPPPGHTATSTWPGAIKPSASNTSKPKGWPPSPSGGRGGARERAPLARHCASGRDPILPASSGRFGSPRRQRHCRRLSFPLSECPHLPSPSAALRLNLRSLSDFTPLRSPEHGPPLPPSPPDLPVRRARNPPIAYAIPIAGSSSRHPSRPSP